MLVLSVCTALAAILSDLLFYRPVAYAWGARIDGTCGDIITTYLAITIVNLLVDLSIVILPLPMLWNFQMPLFKKVGVYLMFSIGIMYVFLSPSQYFLVPMLITFSNVY